MLNSGFMQRHNLLEWNQSTLYSCRGLFWISIEIIYFRSSIPRLDFVMVSQFWAFPKPIHNWQKRNGSNPFCHWLLNHELLDEFGFICFQKGRMKQEEVCFYAAEIVDILEYIHSQGVIHRDLKVSSFQFQRCSKDLFNQYMSDL
jgi:serine/threonine protein kinase